MKRESMRNPTAGACEELLVFRVIKDRNVNK